MSPRYDNERQGEWAEEQVAREFDLAHVPNEAEWYDCVNPRTGTKFEVKSATRELDSGAAGRFRLWEDQHRSLVASDAQGTAWYVFVVLGSGGAIEAVERMHATTVTELVNDAGGWNRAGHDERESRQLKLPIDEVVA